MKRIHKIIKVGDHYIDCGCIPRVCMENSGGSIKGRSLIDGGIGLCSSRYCDPWWVHKGIAERWAKTGPLSDILKKHLKEFIS